MLFLKCVNYLTEKKQWIIIASGGFPMFSGDVEVEHWLKMG